MSYKEDRRFVSVPERTYDKLKRFAAEHKLSLPVVLTSIIETTIAKDASHG